MSKQSVPEKVERRRSKPAPSRALRGVELYREDARRIHPMENGFWSVPSCSGRKPYVVDLVSESCTCPDWREQRKPCKHVFAAAIAVSRRGRASGRIEELRERRAEEVALRISEPPPAWPSLGDCQRSYKLFLAACALYPCDGVLVGEARKRHQAVLVAHDEHIAVELSGGAA